MSLTLLAAIASGGAALSLLAWGVRRMTKRPKTLPPAALPPKPSSEEQKPVVKPGSVFTIGSDSYVIDGVWSLWEGEKLRALIGFCRDGVLLSVDETFFLGKLCPLDFVGAPSVLEVARTTFHRSRRIPVEVRSSGEVLEAPLGNRLLFEFYGPGDQQLWVVGSPEGSCSFLARRLVSTEFVYWGRA